MIAVMVWRPDLAVGDERDVGSAALEGTELLGLFDDVREDSVTELVNTLADEHPDWRFSIDPGVNVSSPEEVYAVMHGGDPSAV